MPRLRSTAYLIWGNSVAAAILVYFLTMCKLAGVPADTKVQVRTAPRRQLRQLEVKADSVSPFPPDEPVDATIVEEPAGALLA